MKKRSVLLALVLTLFLTTTVSAGIYFSEPQSKYNLGNIIDININVDPIQEGRLLKANLICQGDSIIEFNNLPDESGNVNIKLPLNPFTIKEVSGECFFSGEYAGETRESSKFEISKRLNVYLSSESYFTNPNEEITISGTAEKLNTEPVNGEVEITIPLLKILEITDEPEETSEEEQTSEEAEEEITEEESQEEQTTEETTESEEIQDEEIEEQPIEQPTIEAGKFYGKVINGEFSISFNLPDDSPAGDYRIDVFVFEEIEEQKTSEGVAFANLKVFQVLKNIDIALNNQNFNPGTNIEIKTSLLDQTEMNIEDQFSILIKDEQGLRIYEQIVNSQETTSFAIPSNLTTGYYEIEARVGGIRTTKNFYVNEKAILSFELINESLIVTNIGNIPYNQDIQVELNGKPFVKNVELELGESKEFRLTGSNEEYNIRISDGETELNQGGVVLTGGVVSVESIKEGVSLGLKSPITWIFLIIVLGIGIFFLLRIVFKKKSFAYPFFKKTKKEIKIEDKDKKNQESLGKTPKEIKGTPAGALTSSGQAEQVLVLKGHRNRASVIVLKIKNKIGNQEKQSLERAIEHVYSKRGAVYEQGDFIFVVLSPLMTRTTKNEVEAAKVAQKIIVVLKEHNKKFKNKIDFGIGIHTGEIINKVENKKLKFTALGNFIVVAKRLAEASNKQILVTKQAYERGIAEIKAEKKSVAGGEVYEVRQIIDKEKNKKFINGFLERMKKGEGE